MANRPNQQQSEQRRRDVERLAADLYARLTAAPGAAKQTTADARTDQALAEAQAFYDRLDARQTEEK